MTRHDRQLLLDAYDELECGFQFCEGLTLRPKPMSTCRSCHAKARIAKRLGFYIPVKLRKWKPEEWAKQEHRRRRGVAMRFFGMIA